MNNWPKDRDMKNWLGNLTPEDFNKDHQERCKRDKLKNKILEISKLVKILQQNINLDKDIDNTGIEKVSYTRDSIEKFIVSLKESNLIDKSLDFLNDNKFDDITNLLMCFFEVRDESIINDNDKLNHIRSGLKFLIEDLNTPLERDIEQEELEKIIKNLEGIKTKIDEILN